jgi:hypothetical protein
MTRTWSISRTRQPFLLLLFPSKPSHHIFTSTFVYSFPLRGLLSLEITSNTPNFNTNQPTHHPTNKLQSICSSPSPPFSLASSPSLPLPSPMSRVSTASLVPRSRPARQPTATAASPTSPLSRMLAPSTAPLESVCLEALLPVSSFQALLDP